MKDKTILIMMMFLLVMAPVFAADIMFSEDNVTWENITSKDDAAMEGYQINLQGGTTYYFRGRENSTDTWRYISQQTKNGGESSLGSLAITIFILGITAALYYGGFSERKWSQIPVVNLMVKRSLILLATFLMVLNSAIMADISTAFNLGLESEMFMYMWIFGRGGYALMIIIFFKTIFDVLGMWKQSKKEERMGGRYE